jgi:hypothetical protein
MTTMKKKDRLKLRRGLRALKAQSVDLVHKLRSIPQTIGRRQTLPAGPWEEFTPKYRDREPVPGSRHYLLEERDRAQASYMGRSAAWQRFTGRARYAADDDGGPIRH